MANRVRRVQDPVHGLMEFRGPEGVVIDVLRTRELQRLRRVRQLGLVHLVFPGGEHSRLVHSLGAAYLAILFGRRLRDAGVDDAATRDFALAALFHDLGHGPLSHAWEREIVGEQFDAGRWKTKLGLGDAAVPADGKWHVLVGQALLAWPDGDLHRLLERHERGSAARLRDFLLGRYRVPFLPRLLVGDVDVDRADYLRRDTLHCGVAYGGYDLNWLISTCTVGATTAGEPVVGFDGPKALRVVEQFLIARRALYETVYHHKTVRAAEGMVALFLRRLKAVAWATAPTAADRLVRPLLTMAAGEPVGPEELLSVDDFALQVLIDTMAHDGADAVVRDLGQRILARDLFKLVPAAPGRVPEFLRRPDATARLGRALRPHVPGPAEYYAIIDRPRFRALAERPAEWGYFVDTAGRATPMRDHESLRPLLGAGHDLVRLFVPREAVADVARVVG